MTGIRTHTLMTWQPELESIALHRLAALLQYCLCFTHTLTCVKDHTLTCVKDHTLACVKDHTLTCVKDHTLTCVKDHTLYFPQVNQGGIKTPTLCHSTVDVLRLDNSAEQNLLKVPYHD